MLTHTIVEKAARAALTPIGDHQLDGFVDSYYLDHGSTPDDRPIYYRFLYQLSRLLPGMTMVELGCRKGEASLHFLRGGGKAAFGIDHTPCHDPELFAGLDYRVVAGDSESQFSVEAAKEYLGVIDIVFLDTDHRYENTLAEYQLWRPIVRKGGLFMFDDIRYAGVAQLWKELTVAKLALLDLHPLTWGFGVLFV